MNASRKPNQLIHETSPYLLQHAYNPVSWRAWNQETLKEASERDKPIIVSIGYSACHWCHVMEKESFENAEIAALMNEHFICIKVDREERPDVDHIYMEAVQFMGISGGWPLNVFLTSDQKPFYGGTYFPPQAWKNVLDQVSLAYQQNRNDIQSSAEKFAESLRVGDLERYGMEQAVNDISMDQLRSVYNRFSRNFDLQMGGMKGAPKFPMPAYWQFALKYSHAANDNTALEQAALTLREMANGGIYDHIGGGFARYSVDEYWFVPHFEKMLYDNAQLLSLYAEAYTAVRDPRFRQVVYQTVDFIEREMMSPEGGFYAALDADSEGEEGKYYVWDANEVSNVLYRIFQDEDKISWICRYYHIKDEGNWEKRKNILYKDFTDEGFALNEGIEPKAFTEVRKAADAALFNYRNGRIRPGLDDKILSGWNGLALKGLADAYKVFGETRFRDLAIRNANFIVSGLFENGRLLRNGKKGSTALPGFLEDYALVIQGFTELYQAVFDEKWLENAVQLTEYVLNNFFDPEENLFFYTDRSSGELIARKKEIFDNVIPSSNSVMANNLYKLSILTDNRDYRDLSIRMVMQVSKLLFSEPQYMSGWSCLYTDLVKPTREVAIAGPQAEEYRVALEQVYIPNKVVAGTKTSSSLPLLQNRNPADNKTTIYVCYNKTCKMPVTSVEQALDQMRE